MIKIGDIIINKEPTWCSGLYKINSEHNSSDEKREIIGIRGKVIEIGRASNIGEDIYLIKWEDDMGFCSKSFDQIEIDLQTKRDRKIEQLLK